MFYYSQRKKLCSHLLVGGALLAVGFGMNSCKDTYDLDSEQPDGLNSIYGYLEEQGNFQNYKRLIEDLGQTEIFSKTGSKTVFAADDAAFAQFFANNSWGVKSYEELSYTQKVLLLNASMIDNPYSTSMLSTAEGPVRGEVCRRSSSQTLYDSVLVVDVNDAEASKILPDNEIFNIVKDRVKSKGGNMVLFTDASNSAPLIHFNYKFVSSNKLQDTDIDFLYNQPAGTRNAEDVYVNDAVVVDQNIFCKNGFIHKVNKVITPLDNMAEVIRKDPECTIFSKILERFAAPEYAGASLTSAYNNVKGKSYDSIFIKKYFSDRSSGSSRTTDEAYNMDQNVIGKESALKFEGSLKFDPGWNGYMPLSGEPRDAMMEDMAVMLVPTDEAFMQWWNTEAEDIKKQYHTIEGTPSSVFDDLVSVNMLSSLVASVPSRFSDVLDEANDPLGIKLSDVKSVELACNGVIYKTNKVFSPSSYKSVLQPAVIDTANFKVIETAIRAMDYDKYLLSTVAEYIFLLPTNDGLLSYVDPVSYGTNKSSMWSFRIDPAVSEAKKSIVADVYECTLDPETKQWTKGELVTTIKGQDISSTGTILYDRLSDLLDNMIVVTGYQNGKKYYRTKGNTYVQIDGIEEGSAVWGAFQKETGTPLNVINKFQKANGITLVVDGPIMGTHKSVAKTINEIPEFSEFYDLMVASGAVASENPKDKWAAASREEGLGNLFNLKTYGDVGAEDKPASSTAKEKATYLLNNYHYTMYIPTNDAMQAAYDMGLPSVDVLADAEMFDLEEDARYLEENGKANPTPSDSAARVREAMLDFVKYHIQDNSVFIDGYNNSGTYESGKTSLIAATESKDGVTEEELAQYEGKLLSKELDTNPMSENYGKYIVVYYTGKYSAGRPNPINVTVSGGNMTVTDKRGDTHHVIPELSNIMASEYWISKGATTSGAVMKLTDSAHQFHINNSSFVAIQGIDGALLYSPKSEDIKSEDGSKMIPAQFIYEYKPLSK